MTGSAPRKSGTTRTAPAVTSGAPDHPSAAPGRGGATPRIAVTVDLLRWALGLVFLWAFLDKTFGLGYATSSERAWVHGGSPTRGFLSGAAVGPLESWFHRIAGVWWADWLFMLGLLGTGVCLLAGVGLRLAAVAGSLLMLLMWFAEFPPARSTSGGNPTFSTNPLVDYHLVYALALVVIAALGTGGRLGLGRWWTSLPLVREHRWLS